MRLVTKTPVVPDFVKTPQNAIPPELDFVPVLTTDTIEIIESCRPAYREELEALCAYSFEHNITTEHTQTKPSECVVACPAEWSFTNKYGIINSSSPHIKIVNDLCVLNVSHFYSCFNQG